VVATAVSLRFQQDERRRQRRGVKATRRREKVEKMREAKRVLLSLLARIRNAAVSRSLAAIE